MQFDTRFSARWEVTDALTVTKRPSCDSGVGSTGDVVQVLAVAWVSMGNVR